MKRLSRAVLAVFAVAAPYSGGPAMAQDEAAWAQVRPNVTGDRAIEDGGSILTLIAPKRAEDAAIVPIEVKVKLPDGDRRRIKALTLVVDNNPAPVVGTFRFEDGRSAFDLATRIRVDSYSYLRAIAESDDGRLFMSKVYVKAAGGCSAPASKDPAEARANLGQMRFRAFADRGEAQVQLRHPNFSGLQMDQVTRLYTPAWYVESLRVHQGDKLLFSMEGGISISEDPAFRFTYAASGEPVTVEAKDTEGRVFRQVFPAAGSGS